MQKNYSTVWLLMLLALAACQQVPVPTGVKVGKPYVIDGRTYYPEYDPTYDKIGEASWYGPGFHGKYTANGEIFDQNTLTAAHPTLPMPSLVRVTNLQNGKSKIIRINDRGPFKSNRIIDLSKKSAQELGIKSLAKVRVQYLKQETEQYIASLQSTKQQIDMVALNKAVENKRDDSILRSTEPPTQVVESTISNSTPGQVVADAAPIMSVSVNQPPASSSNLIDQSGQPVQSRGLVARAWADDSVAQPNPPPFVPPQNTASPASQQVASLQPSSYTPAAQQPFTPPARTAAKPIEQNVSQTGATLEGRYFIQAGSFSEEANANKLSSSLGSISTASVSKVDAGEKSWWRVKLGPFAEREDAMSALEKVRSSGAPDARIVHQ